MIIRKPDRVALMAEEKDISGMVADFEVKDGRLTMYLAGGEKHPTFVKLRWEEKIPEETRVLGDAWERGYGNLAFRGLEPENAYPWYCILKMSGQTRGIGVMTCPNAMVSFSVDAFGVCATVDVRCGGKGVELGERTLEVCTFADETYDCSTFEAMRRFCLLLSPGRILPDVPIYGGNNWYYAYGNSSREDILAEAKLQAELAKGLENRPFMVIDDGWQINSCAGPWFPNEKYGDMRSLADEMKNAGVRPGLWVRFLRDESAQIPLSWRLNKKKLSESDPAIHRCLLDPSVPEVLAHVKEDVRRFVFDWGYELIKYDYSEFDMFGYDTINSRPLLTGGDWSFSDRSRTSAEIVKEFYKAIYEASGGSALLLGCNCIGHLIVGYAHANRTGDDVSGYHWSRTRKMGINTLAFRLCQHNAFFAADADCVGYIDGNIDKKLNKAWAKLLAYSGSPFFLSCGALLCPEDAAFFSDLYRVASEGKLLLEPLDFEYNSIPARWKINGKEEVFDFYGDPKDSGGVAQL